MFHIAPNAAQLRRQADREEREKEKKQKTKERRARARKARKLKKWAMKAADAMEKLSLEDAPIAGEESGEEEDNEGERALEEAKKKLLEQVNQVEVEETEEEKQRRKVRDENLGKITMESLLPSMKLRAAHDRQDLNIAIQALSDMNFDTSNNNDGEEDLTDNVDEMELFQDSKLKAATEARGRGPDQKHSQHGSQ
ncbi:hypothetical protein PRZ48_009004 [Zasmidium cellare]|uniref:Uncharacterized protein n=1 Tax=Zasmidium cellare TaxID=395010 RepID=A0ABR0EH34_ZASCE|nr:hypothetical protein PRZ48_009004 [Zasmidium cellare]